jgi:hypothetical protein
MFQSLQQEKISRGWKCAGFCCYRCYCLAEGIQQKKSDSNSKRKTIRSHRDGVRK